jgi:hypothetical protein
MRLQRPEQVENEIRCARRAYRARVLKTVIIALFVCAFTRPAVAACSGSSPTRTAASASRADVIDCITAASSGDRINVPAGTASWGSPILLPGKDLTIDGASVITCSNGSSSASPVTCTATNDTNITCSVCFTLPFTATHVITGFTMLGANGGGFNYAYGSSVNVSKHFRIYRNRIVASSWAELQVVAGSNCVHPQGVIDQNILVNISIQPQGGDPGDDINQGSTGACQTTLWAQPLPIGSQNQVVYIERNHLQNTSANINSTDSNHAGRYVFRFNNTTSGRHTSEVHGVQGSNRGSQLTELYENAASGLVGFSGTANWRGGSGVAFNNRQSAAFSFGIMFSNDRSELDSSIGTFGDCDGSHAGVDANTSGGRGWRCRDQPGVGSDTVPWVFSPPGTWRQVAMPIYVWGNMTGGSAMAVQADSQGDNDFHIQANRDWYQASSGPIGARPSTCAAGTAYWATDEGNWNTLNTAANDGRLYKCTAANTWTLYYTPLTYPHPWTGSATPPAPPINLRIVGLLFSVPGIIAVFVVQRRQGRRGPVA